MWDDKTWQTLFVAQYLARHAKRKHWIHMVKRISSPVFCVLVRIVVESHSGKTHELDIKHPVPTLLGCLFKEHNCSLDGCKVSCFRMQIKGWYSSDADTVMGCEPR